MEFPAVLRAFSIFRPLLTPCSVSLSIHDVRFMVLRTFDDCNRHRNRKHALRAQSLVARGDSRESIRANRFALETPVFIAGRADSHESLEFPIRANHATKAQRFWGTRIEHKLFFLKLFGRPRDSKSRDIPPKN